MTGRLVLGLGGTVDYEVAWDGAIYDALAEQYGVAREELTTSRPIEDERTLVLTILAFVVAGAGGERFVESSDIIERFADRFATEVTLGGTGVRAGIALDRLGIPTTQHLVSIDDTVRRLLPASMSIVSSATRDTLDPHLIVQFPAGARVRLRGGAEIVSPAPNRLIFANDPPNREMAIAGELGEALAEAEGFVISGFNTMKDGELLARRLDELASAMRRLPGSALVYYEDAGFYEREFAERIRGRLLPRIDVYGMNEDELQEYLGRSVDLLDVSDVVGALGDIRHVVRAKVIVVHTRYWAIAVGEGAERHRAAIGSAVRVAATRFRLGDGFTAADIEETEHMARHAAGATVVDGVLKAMTDAAGVAAFDLDVSNPTTIGLGDTFVGGFLVPTAMRESE